jgi:hypothetical protein
MVEGESKTMRIIDADKYQKELLSAYDDVSMEFEVLDRQPLVSAIPIPEGATNGDMIKAMFNDFESALLLQVISKEWWNAPYKGEYNLSEKPTGSESEDWE